MSDDDVNPPLDPLAPESPDSPVARPSVSAPSWQEQDILLRDLWTQNKSQQEISAILGRSVAAIMTRAARLGLPRRAAPGRKPGSRRVVTGDVRMTSPRPSSNKSSESKEAVQTSTRICLMCLRSFPSQGPHNRICPSCKNSSEYESAVSLSDITLPV